MGESSELGQLGHAAHAAAAGGGDAEGRRSRLSGPPRRAPTGPAPSHLPHAARRSRVVGSGSSGKTLAVRTGAPAGTVAGGPNLASGSALSAGALSDCCWFAGHAAALSGSPRHRVLVL